MPPLHASIASRNGSLTFPSESTLCSESEEMHLQPQQPQQPECCVMGPMSPVSKMRARDRKVTFNLQASVFYPVCHLNDMTCFEIECTWYHLFDYQFMKEEPSPLIEKLSKASTLNKVNSLETNRQTTRGLEFRTKEGATKRQSLRLRSVIAVLREQKQLQKQMQKQPTEKEQGVSKEGRIAQAYRKVVLECGKEAEQRGLQDWRSAHEYFLQNMDRDQRELAQAHKKYRIRQQRQSRRSLSLSPRKPKQPGRGISFNSFFSRKSDVNAIQLPGIAGK